MTRGGVWACGAVLLAACRWTLVPPDATAPDTAPPDADAASPPCGDAGGCLGAPGLTAGRFHNCVGQPGGRVQCWGSNGQGRLGTTMSHECMRGDAGSVPCQPTPTGVESSGDRFVAVEIAAGANHSCALDAAGQVYCWGSNEEGQLGSGSRGTNQAMPAAVQLDPDAGVGPLAGVRLVAVGAEHTCAARAEHSGPPRADDEVYCWGDNTFGQLGIGDTIRRARPAPIVGLTGVTALAAGGRFTCALRGADGQVVCWGDNASGQTGANAGQTRVLSPGEPVALPIEAGHPTQITAGLEHACALTETGAVYCWGNNIDAALGRPGNTSSNTANPPGLVAGLPSGEVVVEVRSGPSATHTCARFASGGMACWGENDAWQLGHEAAAESPMPRVLDLPDVSGLALGELHTCALREGPPREVWCWGSDGYGQLGDGTAGGHRSMPQRVLTGP